MSSSPWGKIGAPEQVNLEDIMSEQLAKDLQDKEDRKHIVTSDKDKLSNQCLCIDEDELYADNEQLKSDEEIARMLQQQYDKEHDDNLKRSEEKFNGTSKVSISFSNYRRAPLNTGMSSNY